MARRRSLKKQQFDNVFEIDASILRNSKAAKEGPTRRKTWSKHDIKHIKALTPPQREMIHDYIEGQNIIAAGSAGTGKTFVGIYIALTDMLSPDTDREKIIIIRSAVPTRDMGFTPGTLEEKAALYEIPYVSMFAELMGRAASYDDMKEAGIVEFQTTSYIRGVTWDNAIIVVDECQSMTFHELNTIMTRLGKGSRIILCGDLPQTDLRKKGEVTGMDKMLRIAKRMRGFTEVTFCHHDIVRSDFVKEWITASEEEGD